MKKHHFDNPFVVYVSRITNLNQPHSNQPESNGGNEVQLDHNMKKNINTKGGAMCAKLAAKQDDK